MTPFKFFVSLLICVVSVFTAILGFNYCLIYISAPSTIANLFGLLGIVVDLGFVYLVYSYLKRFCS